MVQRIKYIPYLTIFCILGIILTQGYWLHKDYHYYRQHPPSTHLAPILSILLILFTTTSFIFILVTIFKQRKLSLAKSDFINNMTHELKTPLATVSVAIEAMRNFGAWDNQDKARQYLSISRNELDHLSKLIELILQQSIVESHKMEITAKYTHVNGMIRKVIQNYTLSNEQVDIIQNYADHIPPILLDPLHMSNVLRNLIDNAIKYSDVQKKISISSKFQNQNWILAVGDNGIGIPKIYQKDIFERFFRVPRGEINPVKGFGLGLSYIKQVVDLHHGNITLQSSENQGSTFTISIPLKKTAMS
ncbi:HAMP domain-containing sensor histidine kinase [Pedobacter heparinus]|uniref:sensor histidine kinase n=1 Tax=Pedobacter heparinus TaxID=984 RepID=UPI002930AC88|nr:HAMP domain-containing sensor histidine kinase [Pedobacter heparinus]